MAAIRCRDNKATELRLASILRVSGIMGWRRNRAVPGKPDFVFPKERVAVFVDGCFWHGCRWHCRWPKSRVTFWRRKINRNKQRDREVGKLLRRRGWRVVRVWEHALARPERVVERIEAALASPARSR